MKFADDSHKRADEKININRKADDSQAMTAREPKDGTKTRDSSLKVSLMDAKKELKCGICTDKFTDPRLLSCLHTFCFNCLRRYIDKGKHKAWFPCPLCNRKIDIPKGGVKSLRSNMYVTAAEGYDKNPPCDICEVGNKAIERCLDCEENMCTGCLTFHHKMKATRAHRTSPIVDTSKSKPKIQEKQYCQQHGAEELRFYCVPCAKIVCRDCKTLFHTTHQTQEITEVAQGRKREIRKSILYAKEFLPKVKEHIKALGTMVKSLEKNSQNTTKEIKNQAKKLHDEVDRMSSEMITEIKQKNKEMENTLVRNIKAAEVGYASMESIILAAESFMNVGSDHDVIENSGNIRARVEKLGAEIPAESVDFLEFKFSPGAIPSVELWDCFGSWTANVATTAAVSLPHQIRPAMALIVRELNSFSVPGGKAIIAIAPTEHGNAWICNSLSEHVFLYSKNGACKDHVNTHNEVGDLYVASDGSVLMSFPTLRKIKRLTSNGQMNDLASTPLFPSGLAQTESGDFLVCGMEKLGDGFKTGESKGSVLRVTSFGRVERFDKERQVTVFNRPIRIAVNANKDICVSDWSKGNDHVVALTSDGKMKWRYYGPKTLELSDKFVPNSIACDKYCQILVADSHNRAIHLVDKDGRFIKLLLTEEDGIGEPWSVAVDKEGFLWVGDTDGTVKVFKYMS